MSQFKEALDATVQHLENLKRAGVTHVPVRRETLEALSRPVQSAKQEMQIENQGYAASEAQDMFAERIRCDGTTKTQKLAALREQALGCTKCKHLAASRKQVVFGVGNPDSELLFVGEAPGADEDRLGEPFVGRAGQLLTKIIETMGFKRSDIYIANVLKCRPNMPAGESGNRQPTDAEMQTCLPWLHAQIDIIQPKVIVALGSVAMRGLMPEMTTGITKLRGHWLLYRNIPLMPTYHPAFVLRQYTLQNRRLIWEDMLQVLERLGQPVSGKQRNYFKSP